MKSILIKSYLMDIFALYLDGAALKINTDY